MKIALASVTVWMSAVACGGGDGSGGGGAAVDAASVDAMLTCRQIADGLRARSQAVSKQCVTVDDCTLVGYASIDGIATCNCGHAFATNCQGEAVNYQAWLDDPSAQELLVEWRTRCLTVGCGVEGLCGCDCGLGDLGCSANGFCGMLATNACSQGAR